MNTIGEMFAGYGGLGAAIRAIFPQSKVTWVAENDPWASHVLRSHYGDAIPNHGDVTTTNWDNVEPVDVLAAGFPCQDISIAGFRRGIRPDTRSGLWAHTAYAIEALRPALVVIENVRELRSAPAHTDLEPCPRCLGDGLRTPHLRALGRVLGDLATLGYDARWHSNRASDIGAPHQRERVFIVAAPGSQPTPPRWPTVSAPDTTRRGPHPRNRPRNQRGLPTPRASDGTGAGAHGTGGVDLRVALSLLPTPAVNDMGEGKTLSDWDVWRSRQQAKHRNTNGHGPSLAIEAAHHYGRYAPAIRRWERLTRPAPAPVEAGPRVASRANIAFVEWMMGLPEGHVAGRVPRKPGMKLLGNGVVPQQAEQAIREMLNW